MNSLIEGFLMLNPDMKRDAAEIEQLEKRNIFTADTVNFYIFFYSYIV